MNPEIVFYTIVSIIGLLHLAGLVIHLVSNINKATHEDPVGLDANENQTTRHIRQIAGALAEGVLFGAFLAVSYAYGKLMDRIQSQEEEGKSLKIPIYQKKIPAADISYYSSMFLFTGLLLSLALVIAAIQRPFYDITITKVQDQSQVEEDEIEDIPITKQTPPPPPQPVVQPEVKEVKDDKEIEKKDSVIIEQKEDEEVEEVNPNIEGVEGGTGPVTAPPEEEKVQKIFDVVEEQPKPKGGMSAFVKYLSKNIEYPSQARRMEIEGRVFVKFVVNKDGSLSDFKVVKGIGGGCDKEALRVLRQAPKWKPGKQRGKPVRVWYTVPVNFRLH